MDAHHLRLVQPRRIEADRRRDQRPVRAAGITGDPVPELDPALRELRGDPREIGGVGCGVAVAMTLQPMRSRPNASPAPSIFRSGEGRRGVADDGARATPRPATGREKTGASLGGYHRSAAHAQAYDRRMAGVSHALRRPSLAKALAVLASAIALSAPTARPTLATDPADPLDATMLDVALVRWAPTTPNWPPDLLVVEPDDETRGSVKVGLLRRNGTAWSIVAAEAVQVDASRPDVPAPWLVSLGDGRFALLSASVEGSSTDIVPLTVSLVDGSGLQVGTPVQADFAVSDAGAADVDGDGVNELVVSSSQDAVCGDTTVAVFAGSALEAERTWSLPGKRLAGAAVGEFDGQPGAELLAHAYSTCIITPDGSEPHHLVVVRLADGAVTRDDSRLDEANWGMPLGVPLLVDVDGDGRDEAVVRDAAGLIVMDPSHDWTSSSLGVGDALALVAFDAPGRVIWVAEPGTASGSVTGTTLRAAGISPIDRAADGRLVVPIDAGYTVTEPVLTALATTFGRTMQRAIDGRPPPASVLDFDRDGCPDIVTPMVIAPCLGIRSLDLGPDWLATVPIAAYDESGQGTALLALGLDWSPGSGNPPDPSPVGAAEPSLWRHGPSHAFRLVEVPSGLLGVYDPPPPPSIDTAVAPDGSTAIAASPGARLLVRARPLEPGEAVGDLTISREAFLSDPVDSTGTAFMTPPIVAPEGASVPRGASASFDVRSLPLGDGSRADRWVMDAAQIDALGNSGGPIRETVILDVSAPALAVDPPLLSPTWPVNATLHGRSEAAARVRLGEGEPVQADANGAFEVKTPLAPWPQTLELSATDAFGNATTSRVSVMGGIDVRQLPWPAMLTITFLLGAVVTTMRGARRGGPADIGRPATTDEAPMPEIEELISGLPPRD